MPSCFVIMPITTPAEAIERYSGDASHFVHVLDHLFVPAIERAGYEPIRPTGQGADLIQAAIVRNLETADVVLCDISGLNPNVFFELGIRTALDKAVCIVRDDETPQIPFDTGIINTHTYHAGLQPWRLEDEIKQLADHLTASVCRADGRNSLWRYFGLTQRGTAAVDAIGDPPHTHALRPIMDELQQLRRALPGGEPAADLPSTSWMNPEDLKALVRAASPFGEKAERFARYAAEVAGEVGAVLTIAEIDEGRIVFDLRNFILDAERRYRIVHFATLYSFEVKFVGGRMSSS